MVNIKNSADNNNKFIHVKDNIYKIPYLRKNNSPSNKYYIKTQCVVCKKTYFRDRGNARKGGDPICSLACRKVWLSKADGAEKHKRGKNTGHVLVKMASHPLAKKGWVPKHRLILENHLNRYLDNQEIVHHINMDQQDNRLENLCLFSNSKEHFLSHGSLNGCVKQLLEMKVLVFDKEKKRYLCRIKK